MTEQLDNNKKWSYPEAEQDGDSGREGSGSWEAVVNKLSSQQTGSAGALLARRRACGAEKSGTPGPLLDGAPWISGEAALGLLSRAHRSMSGQEGGVKTAKGLCVMNTHRSYTGAAARRNP